MANKNPRAALLLGAAFVACPALAQTGSPDPTGQGVATGAQAADSPAEPSTPQAQGTAAGSQDVVVTVRRRQETC